MWWRRNPGAGLHSYNEVLPLMMVRYLGPGLLGLGITALIAGFMSGMAGNVSAFTAIFTYDIYQPHIVKHAPTSTTFLSAASSTIVGVVISIGAAYLVMNAAGIMDYVQALFSFFISPLLGVVLLGMFWKRATKAGGFWGLLMGTSDLDRPRGPGSSSIPRRCAMWPFSPDAKGPWPRTCIARCGRSRRRSAST